MSNPFKNTSDIDLASFVQVTHANRHKLPNELMAREQADCDRIFSKMKKLVESWERAGHLGVVQAFRLGSLRAATEAYLTRYASYLLA